ncbi:MULTISPECIES: 3-oxoacyl-ACP reductase FabG [Photorhabdus]|uniref:3-oxoacyl-ACP reductase n=1 Tax=Photorhabdus bodei TaxID=2029681 RepID=A0A329XDK7_9GAMM|nr:MULTISPECIES: 3-oxoacyl-ACP reductase FabG [Photorhabdus]NDK99003.1 SDR family oxidoreductase [Photorhabdus bodei]NDL03347.1 SDR family oxidoreductase [Photorhabdus bodei]NDL07461.1 SDR family oxidoreductase [Photorhabdus bodei]RAW99540.1 3-oxoacyl-ACP reductase [Photorhabdus sp. S10-54]RAW99647.1 3-oxoacyl-ACP reductase [Photorhabdus sp. S9-53]
MSISTPWVFISGGSRGIGKGIVKMLAAQNYHVVFTYKSSTNEAQTLCQEIEQQGYRCEGYQCDVSNAEEVKTLSTELISRYGSPYAIINNAGITQDALLINMKEEEWHNVISTNLSSVYLVNHAFLPEMITAGEGCIIHISSVTAFKANSGQVNYAATKAAMIGITRSLAVEVGRFNVRVNTVAPGLIDTEMLDHIPASHRKKLLSTIPLGRLGSVEDIALAINFLLSPGGRYITGQTFVIDGGMTA